MTTKIHNSILQAALGAANNLRATADRLAQAAERQDFDALAEISLSTTTWTVDQIRGAATVIARQNAERAERNRLSPPAVLEDDDAHGGKYLEPFDRGKR
jgi:hypothetical protein